MFILQLLQDISCHSLYEHHPVLLVIQVYCQHLCIYCVTNALFRQCYALIIPLRVLILTGLFTLLPLYWTASTISLHIFLYFIALFLCWTLLFGYALVAVDRYCSSFCLLRMRRLSSWHYHGCMYFVRYHILSSLWHVYCVWGLLAGIIQFYCSRRAWSTWRL